jgi:hypothetical protein
MFGGRKKLVDRQNSKVRRKLGFGYEVHFFWREVQMERYELKFEWIKGCPIFAS